MTTAMHLSGFLRLSQVLALIPISKSVWWEGCKIGRFPKPIKLGPRPISLNFSDIGLFRLSGNSFSPAARADAIQAKPCISEKASWHRA